LAFNLYMDFVGSDAANTGVSKSFGVIVCLLIAFVSCSM
jgi:hypothetical protein